MSRGEGRQPAMLRIIANDGQRTTIPNRHLQTGVIKMLSDTLTYDEFEPYPAGLYTLRVVSIEVVPKPEQFAKVPGEAQWKWKWAIVGGEHDGETVMLWTN